MNQLSSISDMRFNIVHFLFLVFNFWLYEFNLHFTLLSSNRSSFFFGESPCRKCSWSMSQSFLFRGVFVIALPVTSTKIQGYFCAIHRRLEREVLSISSSRKCLECSKLSTDGFQSPFLTALFHFPYKSYISRI